MKRVQRRSDGRSLLGVGLVVASASSYGTLAIFGKLAYGRGIALPTLLSYRFALAALVFWVLVALRAPALPRRGRWLPLVVMGAAGYVGQSASYFGALRLIPASTTSLLLYTFPAVVTLLAALLFHESLSPAKLVALAVALIGTVLVVQAQVQSVPVLGLGLGLLSAGFYSSYILYASRVLPGVPPIAASATIMTAAAGVWAAYAGATGQLGLRPDGAAIALLAGFVLLATVFPVLTFVIGMPLIGPSRAAILSTFEPATTVLLAVLILGEVARPIQYLGGALIILAAVFLEAPGWLASRATIQPIRE
jgi:drug/metabolite transporter (DMT)-like permease